MFFFFFFLNFSFSTYTPPSCACVLVVFHSISLIVNHSYSSLCRWWCRKFIFFFLHTIICMCHLISLICIQYIHAHDFLHLHKTTNTKLLVCFVLLIATLSFPFSLHMPLITTFSSGLWLCWSLITTFSLVQQVGR